MTARGPWPHGDPSRVILQILAQPAYRSAMRTSSVSPKPTLLEVILNWLAAHIVRPLIGPLVKALGASHGVGTVIGIVLVVVAILAFGFVCFRLVVAFVRPAREGGASESAALALLTTRSSDVWHAVARGAAARGDFGDAIAALFAAALVALDERGVVPFDAARAPGEYRRLVRRVRLAAAPPFDELTDRFVYAAYASETPAAPDYEAAERAFVAFEPAVSR